MTMLTIANKGVDGRIRVTKVGRLAVRTGEPVGRYALGGSPPAFHLTPQIYFGLTGLVQLLLNGPQDHHRNLPRRAFLIPRIERSDFYEARPQFAALVRSSDFCHRAQLPILHLYSDLWIAAYIEKPARMALPATIRSGHNIICSIADIDQMDAAWFARLAPGRGKLEEARRAVRAASVSTFSRQVVQYHRKVVQSGSLLWHGSLPFASRPGPGRVHTTPEQGHPFQVLSAR